MYLLKHGNCSHVWVKDAPKLLGHASISKWAAGARAEWQPSWSGGGVPMKWQEHKSTGTKILKLSRNSTGRSYIITETVGIIVVAFDGDFCCFSHRWPRPLRCWPGRRLLWDTRGLHCHRCQHALVLAFSHRSSPPWSSSAASVIITVITVSSLHPPFMLIVDCWWWRWHSSFRIRRWRVHLLPHQSSLPITVVPSHPPHLFTPGVCWLLCWVEDEVADADDGVVIFA